MQSLSYWEAWSMWWSSHKLDSFSMWGLPILWWGRIGKLMQYGGGLIIILDLIGPKRLESAVVAIGRSSRTVAGHSLKYPIVPMGLTFAASWLFIFAKSSEINATNLSDEEGVEMLTLVLIVPTILVGFMFGFLDKLARFPLAILRNQRSSHPARWFAFVILTLGFSFDLLAS